ncbi:MAG: hypothetical protein ACK4XL_07755 [Bacteroidota bacterium]|jgi:hypothetical protein
MENARKLLPIIIGGIVAIVVFFISRKVRQSSGNTQERSQILEKAREAKLAKSILRKSEDEDDTQSIAI